MPVSVPRRQVVLLAVLLVTLGLVVVHQFSGTSPGAVGGRTPRAAGPAGASAQNGLPDVPAVRLADLDAARPRPAGEGRNLFREQPKAPPPAPGAAAARRAAAPDPNAPPPPPPPPPPIPLKFIGLVEAKGGKIAVLSDSKDVFYGREGEVIEGRYRIIRIGVESIEMSYVDGRGRQRIPLTG
jgi:hypothetical protein